MIHLDTHIVTRLYDREHHKLSRMALRLLESEPLAASPMVLLEVEYLHGVGSFESDGATVRRSLERSIGLTVSTATFSDVVQAAMSFAWTRDAFDRLIVANAMVDDVRLLTADSRILEHFPRAVW